MIATFEKPNRVRHDYHRQEWISIDEAALILGSTKKTVTNLKSAGIIEGNKRGLYRIRHSSVEKYMRGSIS